MPRTTAISLLKFSTWIVEFVKGRGLSQPDQRPLYEYQATTDEYIVLKGLISGIEDTAEFSRHPAACACFSLFCAEWYRREYLRQDGWSWDAIWKVLGFQFNAQEIARIVPKGLEGYWKRPIRFYESERRNFLGSIFSEGGLPFLLLKDSDSSFQSLFSRILKQYDQAKLLGLDLSSMIEQQIVKAGLPQAFSEDTSVELIAAMADELVSLVNLYDLSTSSDPVAALESRHPHWRQSFPIPLDDTTGSELLNGLLKTATKERSVRRSIKNSWSCSHYWVEEQPNVLKARVSMPTEILFTLDSKPATTRFDLAIAENDRPIVDLGAGYALVENNQAKVRLRKRDVIFSRRSEASELYLIALAGGMVISKVRIENSIVALGDLPIGFEYINERWELCGQASINTKSQNVIIVLPDEVNNNLEDFSDVGPLVCSKKTIAISMATEFTIESEETYRIKTGCTSAYGNTLDFSGNHLPLTSKPSLTFLGLPSIKWLNQKPDLGYKSAELYFSNKPKSDCVLQELLGVQYISVRNNDNESLLRRKVAILPSDFKLDLKSGGTPSQGSLYLYTKQACITQILDERIKVTRIKHADYLELKLETKGLPPAKFNLEVTPNLMADPVEIEIPFPSSGCMAFDSKSDPLKREICVGDLLGSRVYLFGNNGVTTRFELELRLHGNNARHASFVWSYIAGDNPLEISLYNIRDQVTDLLSIESGIDQIVELRISGNGQNSYYRIRKHATQMKIDYDRQVLFAANLDEENSIYPEPILMLLNEPERKPTQLMSRLSEGVDTGEYDLPEIVNRNGPWLVVPKKDSELSFRPMYIEGNSHSLKENESIQSLQKAVLAFDFSSDVDSFSTVFDAMAINPAHSGWHFLQALYNQFGYLPLATFEVWKSLVMHPSALAMALFKFEMNPDFLSRLESEFPLLWEFLSFSELKLSGEKFSDHLYSKGISEQSVGRLIAKMYQKLTDVFPAYGGEVEKYLSCMPAGPEAGFPVEIFRLIISDWYQELIREHKDALWPDFGGRRLQEWCKSQPDCVVNFDPEMDYRNSVVYLPEFAAAVATGNAQYSDVFNGKNEAIFFLRQVRDFDSRWFNGIYQYCLLSYAKNN